MSEMNRIPDTSCILVCAGNASRMGGINKILMPLGESNVVGHSMLAFEKTPDIAEIIVVTKPEYFDAEYDAATSTVSFYTSHCSQFAVVPKESSSGGVNVFLIVGIVVVLLAVAGAAVFFIIKKKGAGAA